MGEQEDSVVETAQIAITIVPLFGTLFCKNSGTIQIEGRSINIYCTGGINRWRILEDKLIVRGRFSI